MTRPEQDRDESRAAVKPLTEAERQVREEDCDHLNFDRHGVCYWCGGSA